jgi:predicted Zn-dependent protease
MPTLPNRLKHLLVALLALHLALPATVLAQGANDLPDIGSPASSALSLDDEYRIGLQVMRQLRDEGQVIEDPEATEYLQALGSRIVAQATGDSAQKFQFFFVRDDTINAFALPGGFIGVNYGLVLATRNESQLAGVLAHEIAHVTQRHIARRVRSQGRQSVATMAAILAAILSARPRARATPRSAAWPWRRARPCSSRSTSRAPTRTRPTASA